MSKWSLLYTANRLSAVRVIAGKIMSHYCPCFAHCRRSSLAGDGSPLHVSDVRPDENCSGRIRSNVRLSFAYGELTRQYRRSTRRTFRSQTRVRDRRVSDSAELWAYSEVTRRK